jgi:hypothetical protein
MTAEPFPKRGRHGVAAVIALLIAMAGLGIGPRPVAAAWSGSINVYIADGDGTGRVTSDDGGVDCTLGNDRTSGDCEQSYVWADFLTSVLIEITYTPATGSYVCLSGTTSCTTSGAPVSYTLEFKPAYSNQVVLSPSFWLKTYRVQVNVDGPGSVSSSGGSSCTPTVPYDYCRAFKYGSTATLNATPDTGSVFSYWSGSPCTGIGDAHRTCTFTVSKDEILGATFGSVSVAADVIGSGDICATSGAYLCTEGLIPPVTNWIDIGSSLVLEARPATGWRFDHWNSGPCASKPATCSFTVQGDTSLVATFARVATPAPTIKPTAKPSAPPTATSAPSTGAPGATAASHTPAPGQTLSPGQTPTPASTVPPVTSGPDHAPDTSIGPDGAGSFGSAGPPGPPSTDGSAPGASGPARSAPPGVDGSVSGSSPDVTLALLLFLLLAVMVVGLGFILGRNKRRAPANGED